MSAAFIMHADTMLGCKNLDNYFIYHNIRDLRVTVPYGFHYVTNYMNYFRGVIVSGWIDNRSSCYRKIFRSKQPSLDEIRNQRNTRM